MLCGLEGTGGGADDVPRRASVKKPRDTSGCRLSSDGGRKGEGTGASAPGARWAVPTPGRSGDEGETGDGGVARAMAGSEDRFVREVVLGVGEGV